MQHRSFRRPMPALLAVALSGAVTTASAASPEPPAPAAPDISMCGGYNELRSLLDARFGEHPTSSGLADDGRMMQVFASPAAGTWTMVSIDAKGVACVLATGHAWQQEALASQGDPA
jgi:hypothetical protein